LSEIVNICLECKSKDSHLGSVGFGNCLFNFLDDPLWLSVVDISGRANELGILRVGGNNEPRIDSNAVAADTRARLENVHAGVVVRKLDKLPDIDSKIVGNERKLIGESDVDVPERVLRKLCHFGS